MYKLIIIGSGPAGYVAAIRAGQMGMKTLVIEKDQVGGMCLNWGCIPSKALLDSAKFYHRLRQAKEFGIEGIDVGNLTFSWVAAVKRADKITRRLKKGIEMLFKKNAVETVFGEATIIDEHTVSVGDQQFKADYILIATGSRPAVKDYPLPAQKRIEIDTFIRSKELPGNIAIVGQSPTAMELAQLLTLIGKNISLLVPGERLIPMMDPELSKFAENQLKKDGVKLILNAKIKGATDHSIQTAGEEVTADVLLNAEMRQAILPPSQIKFEMNHGFLRVDEFFRTNYENIFAVGDVNGIKPLAHAASAQGINVVNRINGIKEVLEPEKIPINIYSKPEMAQVGLTEPEIKARGIEYKDNRFPMTANGKAMTEGQTEGYVRILSAKKYGEVLGVQIVAANATDLIAEAAAFIQMEGTVFDIAKIVHAHPTVSEVFMEAGFAGVEKAIHI